MLNRKIKAYIGVIVIVLYIGFVGYKYNLRQRADSGMQQEQFTIVTSSYPLYLHTRTITQGVDVEVLNMVGQEVGCLHDYQLTTKDMKQLQEADVFILSKLGEGHLLEKITKQHEALHIIDASTSWLENHKDRDMWEEEHQGAHEEGGSEEHTHTANSHIWLSLEGAKSQIEDITTQLIERDPKYAALYKANSEVYSAAIEALFKGMAKKETVPVVAVHDTFAYLLEEMGIEEVGSIAEGSYENPSPKLIESMLKKMATEKVVAIVTEERYAQLGIVQMLLESTGCKLVVLDSLLTPFEEDQRVQMPYVERMQKNIQLLEAMD